MDLFILPGPKAERQGALARPPAEGERGLEEEDAETEAREALLVMEETFLGQMKKMAPVAAALDQKLEPEEGGEIEPERPIVGIKPLFFAEDKAAAVVASVVVAEGAAKAGAVTLSPPVSVQAGEKIVVLAPKVGAAIEKPQEQKAKPVKADITPAVAKPVAAVAAQTASEPAPDMKLVMAGPEGAVAAKAVPMQSAHASGAPPAMQNAAAAAPPPTAQLVAAIRAENKSGDFEVRLDPPDMGRVRIHFSVDTADAVKAILTVERQETLDYLRRNICHFAEELKAAGFTSIDLEFSERRASDFKNDVEDFDAAAEMRVNAAEARSDVIYLSLRDNAQLNMLV